MRKILTISIQPELEQKLNQTIKRTNSKKSDIVARAIEKYLSFIEFSDLRNELMPFAKKQAYLLDEDIFNDKEIS